MVGSNPASGMDVCRECCVLSGRGLRDELITLPEESYRMWCIVCDLATSRMRRPWPASGRSTARQQIITIHHYVVFLDSDGCILVTVRNQTHAHMDFFFSLWILSSLKYWLFLLNHPVYQCQVTYAHFLHCQPLSAVPEHCVFVTYKLSAMFVCLFVFLALQPIVGVFSQPGNGL
jgi:hypothetical protein